MGDGVPHGHQEDRGGCGSGEQAAVRCGRL